MTTGNLIHDAGHCLRAAALPLLALSVLALARTTQGETPAPPVGVGELVLVAWRVAVLGTLLWFLVAVVWAASRPLRDRRAFQRLQHLREIATVADRALVQVQTIVWSSAAGQHVVVVNVATGGTFRVWLREATATVGSFAVLEQTDHGVCVVDWMHAHRVEAAHRHEARRVRLDAVDWQRVECARNRQQSEASITLAREIEEFLEGQ